MAKTVIDCGNCAPDHAAIRSLLKGNFDVEILQTHGPEDTLEALRNNAVALVTVNRKLDRDYSDGLEVIKQIKSDPELADTPVMLVTNYDEHQQAAVEVGAEPGFGKLSLRNAETLDNLKRFLA